MEFPLLNKDMSAEFDLRVEKTTRAMKEAKADALLVTASVNIFYLAGGVFRGYIYLTPGRRPAIFMIPPAECDNQMVSAIRKPEQIASMLTDAGYPAPRRLALEADDLTYSEVERLARIWPDAEMVNGSAILRAARLQKTDYELKLMRDDGRRQSAVYENIRHCYQEGMSDVELQIEIERLLRREGCLGYLRAAGSRMEINLGSVIAGPNADVPSPYDFSMGGAGVDPSLPVGADGTILKTGMSVMVDMNGGFNGYQTDMTRCWSVGSLPQKAVDAHECSRAILRDLEKYAVPGREISELYNRARRLADDAGLRDFYMGHRHKVSFIGHGVGIELNEAPVIMERNKSLLKENMTIAIEPKFVIPEVGAVGIENTYIVTPSGLENITPLREDLQEF